MEIENKALVTRRGQFSLYFKIHPTGAVLFLEDSKTGLPRYHLKIEESIRVVILLLECKPTEMKNVVDHLISTRVE